MYAIRSYYAFDPRARRPASVEGAREEDPQVVANEPGAMGGAGEVAAAREAHRLAAEARYGADRALGRNNFV